MREVIFQEAVLQLRENVDDLSFKAGKRNIQKFKEKCKLIT